MRVRVPHARPFQIVVGGAFTAGLPWFLNPTQPQPPSHTPLLRVPQLGGLALHEGQVAEMATGEGKTLVATLPAYVNALTGETGRACGVLPYALSHATCASSGARVYASRRWSAGRHS